MVEYWHPIKIYGCNYIFIPWSRVHCNSYGRTWSDVISAESELVIRGNYPVRACGLDIHYGAVWLCMDPIVVGPCQIPSRQIKAIFVLSILARQILWSWHPLRCYLVVYRAVKGCPGTVAAAPPVLQLILSSRNNNNVGGCNQPIPKPHRWKYGIGTWYATSFNTLLDMCTHPCFE